MPFIYSHLLKKGKIVTVHALPIRIGIYRDNSGIFPVSTGNYGMEIIAGHIYIPG